jgi:predicted DNA binding protein
VISRIEYRLREAMWLSRFTLEHPDLLLEFHSWTPGGDHSVGEYEVHGPPVDWSEEIARYPDVLEAERLDPRSGERRYRVRYRHTPEFALALDLEILFRRPMSIQNGRVTCTLVAPLSRVRHFLRAVARAGGDPHLVSLGSESVRSDRGILTPVQRSLFRQALALGYFEVPRRITLTELSEKVARSKSSVSRTLAVVEQKLLVAAESGTA